MRIATPAAFTAVTAVTAVTLFAMLAGCSSAPIISVVPGDDGSFNATVRAETEQLALDSAARSAGETCRASQQQHVVIDSQTRSLGLPARTEDPTEQAAALARYVSAPSFPSLAATDDFEARLQFRCINYPMPATPSTVPAPTAALTSALR